MFIDNKFEKLKKLLNIGKNKNTVFHRDIEFIYFVGTLLIDQELKFCIVIRRHNASGVFLGFPEGRTDQINHKIINLLFIIR